MPWHPEPGTGTGTGTGTEKRLPREAPIMGHDRIVISAEVI